MKRTLALLLPITILGCSNKVPAPIEGRMDPYVPPQVTFAQKDLAKETAVGAPSLQRDDAGNLLHVTLPIRSTTSKTLYVDYQITFYDTHGGVVSQTGWMPKSLEANTPDTISVNSTSDRASDFRLALRWAR